MMETSKETTVISFSSVELLKFLSRTENEHSIKTFKEIFQKLKETTYRTTDNQLEFS